MHKVLINLQVCLLQFFLSIEHKVLLSNKATAIDTMPTTMLNQLLSNSVTSSTLDTE